MAHAWKPRWLADVDQAALRSLGREGWDRFNENELMTRAAGVAFYAMLAIVPFLGLILTLVVRLLPDITGHSHTTDGIGDLTVEQLENTLRSLFHQDIPNLFSTDGVQPAEGLIENQ